MKKFGEFINEAAEHLNIFSDSDATLSLNYKNGVLTYDTSYSDGGYSGVEGTISKNDVKELIEFLNKCYKQMK